MHCPYLLFSLALFPSFSLSSLFPSFHGRWPFTNLCCCVDVAVDDDVNDLLNSLTDLAGWWSLYSILPPPPPPLLSAHAASSFALLTELAIWLCNPTDKWSRHCGWTLLQRDSEISSKQRASTSFTRKVVVTEQKENCRCQLKTDPLHLPSIHPAIHRHKVRSAAVVIKKISKNRLEQQQQHLLDTLSGEWLAGWRNSIANLLPQCQFLSVLLSRRITDVRVI